MKPISSKLMYKIDVLMVAGTIFMLVGIIFLGASVLIFRDSNKFYREAVRTEGTISDIYREQTGKSDVYRVNVSYRAGSELMSSRLNYYSSTMKSGDRITLYYHPDNPSQVRGGASNFLDWLFPGIGFSVSVLGGLLFGFSVRRRMLKKRLLESGVRLNAVITHVRRKRNEAVNGRHPYAVDCEYRSPEGAVYVFSSEALWDRPADDVMGSVIHVYVEPNNYQKYYVDVTAIPTHPVYVMGGF